MVSARWIVQETLRLGLWMSSVVDRVCDYIHALISTAEGILSIQKACISRLVRIPTPIVLFELQSVSSFCLEFPPRA